MVDKSVLLLACIGHILIWPPTSCLSEESGAVKTRDNNNPPIPSERDIRPASGEDSVQHVEGVPALGKAIGGVLNVGARSLEPWLKSFGDLTKVVPIAGKGGDDPISSLISIIQPRTTTTTTTEAPTTHYSPVQKIADGLEQTQLLSGPSHVVSGISETFNLSKIAETPAIKELTRVGEQTEKVFTKISGIHLTAPPEDETVYYEYAPADEWDGHRRPRYFSKECNFRLACEIGRMMKPMLGPVANQFKTNKIVQDLQSRYSRAMAYGTLHNNCEKYYCVFLQLFGGPQKFVAASAEIIAQIARPDPESS